MNTGMGLAVLCTQPPYPVHNGQQQRKDRDLKANDKILLGECVDGSADGTLNRCNLDWTRWWSTSSLEVPLCRMPSEGPAKRLVTESTMA